MMTLDTFLNLTDNEQCRINSDDSYQEQGQTYGWDIASVAMANEGIAAARKATPQQYRHLSAVHQQPGETGRINRGAKMTSPLSTAADDLVAEADSHDADAIRMMAHEMMAEHGCTYDTAKSAVQRAIKRSNGEIGAWGGKRQPAGGRPANQARWLELVREAVLIRNRIIASGEIVTKTRVEDEMMQLHGMERYDAHNIVNYIVHHNLK